MPELSDPTFIDFARLMRAQVGLSLPPSKKTLVSSRLSGRLMRLGLSSFEDYLRLIDANLDGGEFQTAVDLLTTHETYFFREPEHLLRLEREFATRSQGPLSVWSAASSYGDEAYSIAMVLADLESAGRIGKAWSVVGTDVSDQVLHTASAGIFPQDRLRHVSPERLRRYCLRGDGDSEGLVLMKDSIRSHVSFGRLNLCEPIDIDSSFDAIFLRNVLIYFDQPTKQMVVDRVLQQLRPGGLFFIGLAEGRVATRVPLKPLGPGAFRKVA